MDSRQVSKFNSLDWFREYRSLYPEIIGELKSSEILQDFENMPRDMKMRVSCGMRKVRIHIVDTYSYEAEYKQLLRKLYNCDDYEKMLQQEENQRYVKFVIEDMENHIAERVLYDSPAQRLERSFEGKRQRGFGFYRYNNGQEFSKKLVISLDPFRKGKKKVFDTASKWVSKSGSIFADALEFAQMGFWGEYEARQHTGEMLRESHAFDEGDDPSIDWLEEQRSHFVDEVVYQAFGSKKLHGKVNSKLFQIEYKPPILLQELLKKLMMNTSFKEFLINLIMLHSTVKRLPKKI